MALEAYRRKRDFKKTPEPQGGRPAKAGALAFIIQQHAASRLHYDFRLELGGVLKSWAVPKGPSLDPREKRLAVHVEDHPLDYGSFEGVIPAGQYGGGTVLLWDHGTWEPEGDPAFGYRKGHLVFALHGEKLSGGWQLVRMAGRAGEEGKENWLLIKRGDDAARSLKTGDILAERPESVVSGRSLEAIAADRDRVWQSKGSTTVTAAKKKPARVTAAPDQLAGARRARLAKTWSPQLATRVDVPPAGDAWLHEIKFDGYRALCRIERGTARFLTRRGLDWTARFAPLDAAAVALPVAAAALDGEVVVQSADGATSFQDLQEALSAGRGTELVYYAFDLLHLDGWDLTRVPLLQRKAALAQLLQAPNTPATIRYSDHVVGSGAEVFREACRLRLEGIISKRVDGGVMAGRGRDWVKVKCVQRQEFVVGGFTEPAGSRTGFGALLVGLPEGPGGRLRYTGRVGTGFSDATLTRLRRRLGALERAGSPFIETLPRADARGARWVAPDLVAEVEFTEWTRDGRLRHPSFQGLREDILPQSIVREVAESTPAAAAAQKGEVNVKPKPKAKSKPTSKAPATTRSKKAAPGEELIAGIRLTNPDRVLYPGQDVTKRTLAQFYVGIAEWIVPQLAGRPLTLVRCPRGAGGQCFYQKHADEAFPASVRRVEVPEDDGEIALYVAVDSIQGVIALVQLGVLEFHTWGSRVRTLEKPDRIIFDLDPDPSVAWPDVIAGARELRKRLEAVGLETFVKTTGGKGLHVEVPLKPRADWAAVKGFAHGVALALARDEPTRYLATASKAKRRGKIYVDYLRNGRGATAIAAYSTRSRAGAPVATPLRWDELSSKRHPDHYTVATLPRRLATLREDPWAGYEKARVILPRG